MNKVSTPPLQFWEIPPPSREMNVTKMSLRCELRPFEDTYISKFRPAGGSRGGRLGPAPAPPCRGGGHAGLVSRVNHVQWRVIPPIQMLFKGWRVQIVHGLMIKGQLCAMKGSISHNWPSTLNPCTIRTLYPLNSIWMDGMTLHCTWLTLDTKPMYNLDPLPLKRHLIINHFTLSTL